MIEKLMLNDDGTYYVVIKTKTPEGYDVRIDIPGCKIDDASAYKDKLVDHIDSMQLHSLMQFEISGEKQGE